MEKYEEIAKGIGEYGSSKRNQKNDWNRIAVHLNSLGLPNRDDKECHKVGHSNNSAEMPPIEQ